MMVRDPEVLIRTALVSDPPVDDTVMVGEGRPSTSFFAVISKVVDDGPEPVLARAFGPTRGPAMTGEAKPASQRMTARNPRAR
jgi:hypothetical protein